MKHEFSTFTQRVKLNMCCFHSDNRFSFATFGYEALLLKEIPDKNRFKMQIAQARKERIAENQKFDCKKCMDLPQTESSETEQPVEIK